MQCAGITKSGARCTRKAMAGSLFCWQHQNQAVEQKNAIIKPISPKYVGSISVETKSTQSLITNKEVRDYDSPMNSTDKSLISNREKREEILINQMKTCPLDLQTIKKTEPRKLQKLLKDQFYQFNVPEGILCFTSALLNDKNMISISETVNEWFLNAKYLAKGASGYAFSSDLGDAKNLFVIKSSINPNDDDLIHELFIALFGTNKLRKQIPNFAFIYGGFKCGAPKITKRPDPDKFGILLEVDSICTEDKIVHYVIYENVVGQSLWNTAPSLDTVDFIGTYLQILYSLDLANKSSDFTHYDLQPGNIIMRKPFNSKFAIPYQTENGTEYIITDQIATFIDYGYSYIKYQNQDFGHYGEEGFGVLSNKKFPLFDAYKVLLYILQKYEFQYPAQFAEGIKILKFFTSENPANVIKTQVHYYFALPDIKNLAQIPISDLIKYVRINCNTSAMVKTVPNGIKILQCDNNCITLEDILK